MSPLHVVLLAVLATVIGISQAQCYGRVPIGLPPPPTVPYPPSCCSSSDDLGTLLLLARALDKPSDDINSGEIINKLINALIYATTKCIEGSGSGSGGAGDYCGSGGCVTPHPQPTPRPKPSEKKPTLIDLGLLTGDDLLNLIVAGQKLLNLDVGAQSGAGGGAVSNLLGGLL